MSPLPAPGHPDAPKFWRFETSGELAQAIERFLQNKRMSPADIARMRLYLIQWIDSPVWDLNPSDDSETRSDLERLRRTAKQITTVRHIHNWLQRALDIAIDPL